MLKQLQIENFKGWGDTGVMDLAPITVLFGSNSSGKSSIGQFLVMLKQTIRQSDRNMVLLLNGPLASVDLGSVSDVFYNHCLENPLEFMLRWDMDSEAQIEKGAKEKYNEIKFNATISVKDKETQYLSVEKFNYQLYKDGNEKLSVGMKMEQSRTGNRNYSLASSDTFKRTKGRAWKLNDPVKYYGFPDAALSYYQDSDFLQDLNLHHEDFFSKFYYLGPMRIKSKRSYSWSGVNPENVGDDGENTIAALLSARKQNRELSPNHSYKPFEEIVGLALKKMGLIEEYEIVRVGERQEYEVKVKTKGATDFVGLPDVGFGVSQVLPVIVELFYAPDNSVLFIEQPEIHLHPSAQSLLADVIIDAINMRERVTGKEGKKKRIQIILETHSEHMLRRFQRRISEEKLESEKIKAYFAENSKLNALQVDKYGNVLNWPKGFFGDMEEDMCEQSMKAINRRILENNARED